MEIVKTISLEPDYLKQLDKMETNIVRQRMSGGPKGTLITIKNADTGETLGQYHNKVVISGSIFSARSIFGIDVPVVLPNYNNEMQLDNTLDYSIAKPKNTPVVCLFCIGDSGCGATDKDVFTVSSTDRIDPVDDIMPFRYVDMGSDLDDDLRKYYFGRKTLLADNKIAYYFKAPDTTPQLHLRYSDGTQINDQVYNVSTNQNTECYVETRLRVTKKDFREYCEQVRGWDLARFSTLSLCYAWYDDTIDKYRWYQEIQPYSKLNFSPKWLQDLTIAYDIIYSVYF